MAVSKKESNYLYLWDIRKNLTTDLKKMKKTINFGFACILFVSGSMLFAQTEENPWAVSIGANIVSIQDDDVDAGASFGVPAVSLSRYIAGGFSIGAQYASNNIKEAASNGDDLGYYSLDGIVKYNLGKNDKVLPYLFAGYGFTNFSEGEVDSDGAFPSTEVSRTVLGGAGVNVRLTDNIKANVSASYRSSSENYAYNHLQHTVGISYIFGANDADKDGVSDEKDVCPDIPGLKEFDGCPDTDGDGIPDNKDACPEEAGKAELNGCPDADEDGIADAEDACPNAAGSAEMNGCPDSDADGIADKDDNCPNEAGAMENNGCPWADSDNDGVLDKDDACPNEAGDADNKGCPADPKALMDMLADENTVIYFTASSADISGDSSSLISSLAELLKKYPTATINVNGHASSDGSKAFNQNLSEQRANAVKAALVAGGIDGARINAVGYGEDKPIKSNGTVKGRAANRRVDFDRKVEISVQ